MFCSKLKMPNVCKSNRKHTQDNKDMKEEFDKNVSENMASVTHKMISDNAEMSIFIWPIHVVLKHEFECQDYMRCHSL